MDCFYLDTAARSLLLLSAFVTIRIIQWCCGAAAHICNCLSFCRASQFSSLFPRRCSRGVLLHSKLALMFQQNETQSGLNNISERVAFHLPHTNSYISLFHRCLDPDLKLALFFSETWLSVVSVRFRKADMMQREVIRLEIMKNISAILQLCTHTHVSPQTALLWQF